MGTRHLVIVYYKGKYWIAQYGQWDGYPSGEGRNVLEFAHDAELMAKLAAALDAGLVYELASEEARAVNERIDNMEKMFTEKERADMQKLLIKEKKEREEREELVARMPPAIVSLFSNPKFIAWVEAAVAEELGYEPEGEEAEVIAALKKMRDAIPKGRGPPPPTMLPLLPNQQAFGIICPSLSRDSGAQILKIVADATEPIPIANELDFITDRLFCEWAWVLDLDARALECWRGRARGRLQSTRFNHLEAIALGDGRPPGLIASFPLDNLPDEPTFLKACGDVAVGA